MFAKGQDWEESSTVMKARTISVHKSLLKGFIGALDVPVALTSIKVSVV